MDTAHWFRQTKDVLLLEMQKDSNLDQFLEKKDLMFSYFKMLEATKEFNEQLQRFGCIINFSAEQVDERKTEYMQPDSSDKNGQHESKDVSEQIDEQARKESELSHNLKSEVEAEERKMYLFERKIKGGILPSLNGAFVPESIVRKLGLEDYDYVYATEIPSTDDDNRKKYMYELAKKSAKPPGYINHRVQYNYCQVEKTDGFYYVSKSLNKDIRIDDVPQVFKLNDLEVSELGVQVDDFVDIAYMIGKEDQVRILYVHPPVDNLERTSTKRSVSTRKRERSIIRESNIESEENQEKTLENQTIMVVGNEPDRTLYESAIESRGGKMIWVDAKDKLSTFEANVKKSDLVIFLLSVSGHVGMKQIKALCKEYDKPFLTKFGIGTSSLIQMAEEEVKRMNPPLEE